MKKNGMITVFSAAIVLGGWIWASAGDYKVPDTGQNRCYDNSTEIRCPDPGEAFYGQDAQFAGPQPSFQDNGDGTVTDLNTGLMWQQGNLLNTHWSSACDRCDGLTLAGHSDWRLPNRHELVSIVDYGYHSGQPAINETYFPNCNAKDFWSSSTVTWNLLDAWYVDFSSGEVDHKSRVGTYYTNFSIVRCVRAGY